LQSDLRTAARGKDYFEDKIFAFGTAAIPAAIEKGIIEAQRTGPLPAIRWSISKCS